MNDRTSRTGSAPRWMLTGLLLCFFLLGLSCEKSPNGPQEEGRWEAVNDGLDSQHIQVLAIHPNNTNTVFAGTWDGLYKSSNSGGSWARVDSGWAYTHVTAISFNTSQPWIMYAGTQGAGIFKSDDGGSSWEEKNVGLSNRFVYGIVVDSNHPDTLFVGADDGIYWSENAADTLSKVHWYSRAFLAIDPQDGRKIYAGGQFNNFHRSTDGGVTWSANSNGLQGGGPATRILWVLIDPSDPQTLFACSNFSGIYKSTNGGLDWAPAITGLGGTGDVRVLQIDPSNPDLLYAGAVSGVYKSSDGAGSWQKLSKGLSSLDVKALTYRNIDNFYAGTWGDGVFKWAP